MKTSLPSRDRTEFLGIALFLLLASSAFAVVFKWDNPGSGLWNDPVNWENDTIFFNDDAQINNGGTAEIDSTQSVVTGFVTLGGGSGSGTVSMTDGNLRTNFDIRIGGNVAAGGGNGLFDQSGGVIFMNGGNVNVGFGLTAVGVYNISAGSLLENSGTIFAVGNRGIGTVNQSGGSIYIRGGNSGTSSTSVVQLGRNSASNGSGFGSGTYHLSGGILAVANITYGQVVSGAGVTDMNTFDLSGTGRLITRTISILNTAAINAFNFAGGILTANSIGIQLTNNGGTLSPDTADFGAAATDLSFLPFDPIGTTIFTGANSYAQNGTGVLAIDIDFGRNDFVDIGAGAPIGTASLAGKIAVTLLNGLDPALNSTFDILTADSITSTASVIGHTPSCNVFQATIVAGGDGRQILRLVVVPPPTTYAQYQTLYGAGGFTADDDNDGLPNGVEYLLGTLPNDGNEANGPLALPAATFTGSGAAQRARLEFDVADPAPTDATLRLEASDDLGVTDPWTTIATKVGQGPWTGPATVATDPAVDCKIHVTVDDTKTISQAPQRFLRLAVDSSTAMRANRTLLRKAAASKTGFVAGGKKKTPRASR